MKNLGNNILSWCNNPEQGAVEQAINTSKHLCLVELEPIAVIKG